MKAEIGPEPLLESALRASAKYRANELKAVWKEEQKKRCYRPSATEPARKANSANKTKK